MGIYNVSWQGTRVDTRGVPWRTRIDRLFVGGPVGSVFRSVSVLVHHHVLYNLGQKGADIPSLKGCVDPRFAKIDAAGAGDQI